MSPEKEAAAFDLVVGLRARVQAQVTELDRLRSQLTDLFVLFATKEAE